MALKLLHGDGLEPGLAAGEGLGGGFVFEDLAVELEDEEGAGTGFDRPEGAEDVGDAVAEEAADEADVFAGDGLVAGDGGFATGEGDEVVLAEGGEFGQVDRGEDIVVLEAETTEFGVGVVVSGVAIEVEGAVGGCEGGGEGVVSGLGEGCGGNLAGLEQAIENVGFDRGVG